MSVSPRQQPAFVFDFGGVLIDWNPRYLYRKLLKDDSAAIERFLADIDFAEWNLQLDQGYPFASAVAERSTRFPQFANLIRAFDERWEETVGGPIQPCVDLLRELKRHGYPLYGLSNWSAEKFPLVWEKYSFLSLFEAVVLSGEVRLVKPDERIFTLLLERIGRPAKECLFIDDSRANIAAAGKLGFKTLLFESPEQLRQALQPYLQL